MYNWKRDAKKDQRLRLVFDNLCYLLPRGDKAELQLALFPRRLGRNADWYRHRLVVGGERWCGRWGGRQGVDGSYVSMGFLVVRLGIEILS